MQSIKKIIPLLIILSISQMIKAQVVQPLGFSDYSLPHQINIGNGTLKATAPSASLEISGTTKGFLPTRVTTVQRDAIASPATNLVVINSDTHHWNLWDGTQWIDLSTAGNDTTHIRVVPPLFAVDDTTFALPEVGLEDSGYATPALYDSILSAKRYGYVTNNGFGQDSIHLVNGKGEDTVLYVVNVAVADGWVVVPAVNYSGTPYVYDIGPGGIFRKNGTYYKVAPTTIVIDSADATDPRTDVIAADTSGNAVYVPGTPDPDPVKPTLDVSFQIEITHLDVPSGVGASPALDTTFVYKNNEVGNWALTNLGTTTNADNTLDVFEGTKAADVTNINNGDQWNFTTSPYDISNKTSLNGYIKLKGVVPSTGTISVVLLNSGVTVSSAKPIVLNKGNTTTYQPFSIPMSGFGVTSTNLITEIRFFYSNSSSSANIAGLRTDYIYFQRGIPSTPPASTIDTANHWVNRIFANATQDSIKYQIGNTIITFKYIGHQNLQQVTDAGNSTTNEVLLNTTDHGSYQLQLGGNLYLTDAGASTFGVMSIVNVPGSEKGINWGSQDSMYLSAGSIARLVVKSTGQIRLRNYTSSTTFNATDTTSYKPLTVDAQGNVFRSNWLGAGGATPDLQTVTDAGASTTSSIDVNGINNNGGLTNFGDAFFFGTTFGVAFQSGEFGYDMLAATGVPMTNTSKGGLHYESDGGLSNHGVLTLNDTTTTGSNFQLSLRTFANMGSGKTLYFPNQNDTLATLSDIASAIGGSAPDLQAVTDVGNTTTNDITSAGTVTGAYVFGTQIESPDFISDGLFELQAHLNDAAGFFIVGGLYKSALSGYSTRSVLFLHDTTTTSANSGKGAYVMALPNVNNIDTLYMPDHGGEDTLATLSDIRGGIAGSGSITGTTDNLLTVSGSNLNTNKTFSVLTYSATPTWDLTTGYNKTITITGDPVISFSNAQSGDAISLIVAQDGTGGHLLTIGSNAITIDPTASAKTVVGCIYNGTVWSCASGYSTNSGTNTGDVTLAGQTYLTIAGQVITANAVNLSGTHVTGTLAAARFGALTGDVTNSAGSYSTTIANSAITNAKVSASAAISLSKLAITGTPDGTKFLRDDATWQTVTSGFASPMTTLGDIIYEDATPAAARLAGNTTTTKKFLRQTGNGTISAVPAWDVLVAGDIPDLSGTYQPLDADLTTIAGLTATTNNFLVSVSSAWASRTPAQVKTTLSLDNVDNTSDATKNSASVTLTNKTITAPVISSIVNTGTLTLPTVTGTVMQYAEATTASNATWAPAGDARVNWYQLTAQAVAVTTVSAPSGTPANHNLLYIRVKDNGTARAISGWDGIYRAGTDLPFPTTTTVSKNMYVVFCYNSLDTKWDLVDVVNGLSLVSNLLLSIVFGGLVTFMEKRKRILSIAACISLLLLPFSTWTKVPFAATRFYFDRLNTSPLSPAINAGWTKTTVAAYCMAYAGKIRFGRSAAGATQSSAVSGTTAPQKMVGPVYITQPLAAQTILSGATFTFQLRCLKTATAGTGNVWVYVRLCNDDGTNITEIGNCTNTANALTTTATNRNLVLTLGGNITVADNQRIIFEIGENFTTGTTSHTFGFSSSLGPGTGDHTSGDNTETSAFNSWCECSQTLTMAKIGNF